MRLLYRLAFVASLAGLGHTSVHAQVAASADEFVDSVGVNLHLHYEDTIYRENFPLVHSRLLELKVRHVRDGLIDTTWQGYYERHNALGRDGIKGVFIASPHQSAALLEQYPKLMVDSFEAYEAPNELNQSGHPDWVGAARESVTRLHGLRNNPALARFPVYGPSLSRETAYDSLGDVGSSIDYGNLHNYFSVHHPGTQGWGTNGYGSIDWNLQLVQRYSGGKPTVTTETGYRNDIDHPDAISPSLAGKYMPRLLLEQFRKGIRRTYIYELADFSNPRRNISSAHGLLNSDGSPKPAFVAVRELLSLMNDPGPPFTLRPAPYTISGGGADLRHMNFQKRDGTHLLAIWLEVPSYEANGRRISIAPSQPITIALDESTSPVQAHLWREDGGVARSPLPTDASRIALAVTDSLTILELRTDAGIP